MEAIHGRCAGMDVSKRDAKVCVRIAGGAAQDRGDGAHLGLDDDAILALRSI
jgi:hypothetical protein